MTTERALRALVLMLVLAAPALRAEDAAPPADGAPPLDQPVANPSAAYDPWEGYNRKMFAFNLKLDRAIVRPAVHAYRDHVPRPVRSGVSNFMDNLKNPLHLINDLLQGHPIHAGASLLRFGLNLTLGLGGVLDPATAFHIPQSDEDFGQTFGKWGMGPGPYLVLPFIAPAPLRDQVGKVPEQRADPFSYSNSEWVEYGGKVFDLFEERYRLINLDDTIDQAYDPYTTVRDAVLARRAYQVRDGAPDTSIDYDDVYADPAEDTPAEGATPPADAPPSEPPPPPPN